MRELKFLISCLRYWPLWLLLGLAAVVPALTSQAPLRYSLDAASPSADAYLLNFHDTQYIEGRDSRWTHSYSYVRFAGTGGRRAWRIRIELNPYRSDVPGASPVTVTGFVGGEELYRRAFPPGSDWQTIELEVDATHPKAFEARDLVVELRSDTYRSAENPGKDLGVALGKVEIESPAGALPAQTVVPNLRVVLLSIALSLALFLLLSRAGRIELPDPRRPVALWVSLSVVLGLAWAMAVRLVDVVLALPHLVFTLALGYLLLIASSYLLPRLFRQTPLGSLAYVGAALALAFMLRFGISGLPQTNVVDLPYHVKWLRILLDGGFMQLYLPGELSSVPPEWGLEVLIPKSPLFYIALWPLGLVRGIDLPYAMMLIVSLMDALAVVGVFAMLRKVHLTGAIWAALVYAVMPLSFRAFIYGILPTIFAQALTLLALLVAVLWPEKLARPLPLLGWTLLLAASLVAFPTALAFNSFLVVALAIGWVWRRAASRRVLFAMFSALVLALALSFLSYYGLYVGPFLTSTLPALQGGVNIGGKELWPGGPGEMVGWTAGYAISWLPWLVLPLMALLLWWHKLPQGRRLGVLMLAWLVLFLGGMLLNLRIDMIGKHIYYTLPAAAIGIGLLLGYLWRGLPGCRASRALVVLVGMHLAWAALSFFVARL